MLSVSGRILYYGTNVPVRDATVDGNGGSQPSATTDPSGDYSLGYMSPGVWTVRPRKAGDMATAVGAADALHALEASVGRRSLASHQRLACDVTGNGSVSALDASLMLMP